jgi:arylsulfatase A-like enzyme
MGVALAVFGISPLGAQPAGAPNVIVILADDLGWGDLGCYGNPMPGITPHLDALAASGMRFEQGYAASPVCTPSRAAIMASRFPSEVRLGAALLANKELNEARGLDAFLSPEYPTMPRHFREAGYFAGHVGKWHLTAGYATGAPRPAAYGYDYSRTDSPVDPNRIAEGMWGQARRDSSTAFLVDQSLQFLNRVPEGRPFFLNLWLSDPHAPLAPSEEQQQAVQDCCSGGRVLSDREKVYFGTIHEMDRQLGRLVQALKDRGLFDNTILLFTSDNGPEVAEVKEAANAGVGLAGRLRGRKRSLYEGGIRVPLLVSWPDRIAPGIDSQTPVQGVDLWPTLAALAGLPAPEVPSMDGEDLSAAFLGRPVERAKPLIWETAYDYIGNADGRSPRLAIRQGPYKLLVSPLEPAYFELYDLRDRPEERVMLGLGDWSQTLPLYETLQEWHEALYGRRLQAFRDLFVHPTLVGPRREISVYAPEAGQVHIVLYSLQGKLVWEGDFRSELARLKLPEHLPSGQYILSVSSADTAKRIRLILL